MYAGYLAAAEQALFERMSSSGLEEEIKAARLNVGRALADGNTDKVSRALITVLRLIAEHRKLSGDQAEGIVSSLTTILNELGVGDYGAGLEG